jgi:TorA-specific chaperone
LFAKEINADSLAMLNGLQGKTFWAQLTQEEQLEVDVNIIVTRLDELNSEKELLELAADYCSLFLLGTKNSASPYASLYMNDTADVLKSHSKKGSKDEVAIFGEQHQKMTQFLQQSQLEIASEFPEPADHIAVILAYIAQQCQQASYAEQLQFITDNIALWLEAFVMKVTESDQGHFYSALARLTQSWITQEQQWLKEEVEG